MQNLLSKKRCHSGYNILEMLLSLLILLTFSFLMVPCLMTLNRLLQHERYNYQEEIGIYQLQVELAVNKILEVNVDSIRYQTSENECYLEVVNGNLISTPGFVCYLYDIDYGEFYEREEIIYLEFAKKGEYYQFPIAYKQK